jgi:mannose-1-phosphate guanylyltransferase/mannose-6-phosphate isomerase
MTAPIPVQSVIMAGGSSTRHWPLSRAGFPKQLLELTADDRSLLQRAVQRLQVLPADDIELTAQLTVCNEENRFLVLDQLREAGGDPDMVPLESSARNTAPAKTLTALQAIEDSVCPVLERLAADSTMHALSA